MAEADVVPMEIGDDKSSKFFSVVSVSSINPVTGSHEFDSYFHCPLLKKASGLIFGMAETFGVESLPNSTLSDHPTGYFQGVIPGQEENAIPIEDYLAFKLLKEAYHLIPGIPAAQKFDPDTTKRSLIDPGQAPSEKKELQDDYEAWKSSPYTDDEFGAIKSILGLPEDAPVDPQLVVKHIEVYTKIILAFNFLDSNFMLHLFCKFFAFSLKGKTCDQIRKDYGCIPGGREGIIEKKNASEEEEDSPDDVDSPEEEDSPDEVDSPEEEDSPDEVEDD